jgi:hypothetical protein
LNQASRHRRAGGGPENCRRIRDNRAFLSHFDPTGSAIP